jgi:hypothetical protein
MFISNTTQKRVNIYAPYTDSEGTTYPRMPESLYTEIPDPTPPQDYTDETYYRTEQDETPYVVFTKKSEEQIAQVMQQKAKAQRSAQVEAIKVTTQSGKEFDGDETSQTRMARAVLALQTTGTPDVKWVLANNIPTVVTLAELAEALALAGGAQAAIWSAPYEG